MSDLETTYAIIGGGIAGASIAYHLSERTDEPITVFERRTPGSETTAKSMAMYGLYGDKIQYRMKRYGLRLYNEFFTSPKTRLRYDFAGQLEAATTPEGAQELEVGVAGPSGPKSVSGVDRDLLEYVPGEELKEVLLTPRLNTDTIVGAAYRPRVGFMSPRQLAKEFVERARENGVRFETGVQVIDVVTSDGRVTGLITDASEITVDEVICAGGPWNIELARRAGVDLPLRHTLAPILKLQPGESADYSLPVISHYESPYSIYRQQSRDRGAMYIGYSPRSEFDGVDEFLDTYDEYDPDEIEERIPDEIRTGMLETAELLMPSLLEADRDDEWVGIRSQTPDGNPIVGWTERPGFSIAAFHTSGIQLAPKVGEIIARQLVENDPTELYDSLSIKRFEGYTDYHGGNP